MFHLKIENAKKPTTEWFVEKRLLEQCKSSRYVSIEQKWIKVREKGYKSRPCIEQKKNEEMSAYAPLFDDSVINKSWIKFPKEFKV